MQVIDVTLNLLAATFKNAKNLKSRNNLKNTFCFTKKKKPKLLSSQQDKNECKELLVRYFYILPPAPLKSSKFSAYLQHISNHAGLIFKCSVATCG